MPGPSGIPWDGDERYPHSRGCDGTSSKIFLPTSSTEVIRRAGLNIPTGSPIPPELQRLLASKKTVGPARWGAGLRFALTVAREPRESRRNESKWVGIKERKP
jgi:hypothetical protein